MRHKSYPLRGPITDACATFDVIALSVASISFILAGGASWRGEWFRTFDALAGSTLLSGPTLAGLSAYRGRDWASTWRSVPVINGGKVWALPGVAVGGPLLTAFLVHLFTGLAAVGVTTAYRPTDRIDPSVWFLSFVVLGVYAVFGLAVSHVVSGPAAAAVAAVVSYALAVALSRTRISFASVGGNTGSGAGYEIAHVPVVAALLVLLGVGLLGALIVTARAVPIRRQLSIIPLALLVSGLAVNPRQEALVVPGNPTWLCEGTHPRVCLLKGNTFRISIWARDLAAPWQRLKALGFEVPEVYRQPSPFESGTILGVGHLVTGSVEVNLNPPEDYAIVYSLATPASCAEFSADRPPQDALAARDWLAYWIAREVGLPPPLGENEDFSMWSEKTNKGSQLSWSRETYQALSMCALQDIHVPT